MTAIALPAVSQSAALIRPPSLFSAWTSSFLNYVHPRRIAVRWLAISPVKAGVVAAINLVLAIPWLIFLLACEAAWHGSLLQGGKFHGDFIPHPLSRFWTLLQTIPEKLLGLFSQLDMLEKLTLVIAGTLLVAAAFLITFFLLLPFAARPGRNKACVKHVLRTVFLGTGFVHIWAPCLAAVYLFSILAKAEPFFDIILGPLVLTVTALIAWSLASLLVAARRDYRTPADMPPPRDPTCDVCGYDLVASDPAGRCSECGRPVAESIGPKVRLPIDWERRPSPLRFSTVFQQLGRLIRRPQKLFMSMPTQTGQRAAQRWLLVSLLFIGLAASLIPPAVYFLFDRDVGFSMDVIWAALCVGVAWAILALMMVGIETAGIATFSRMKGRPVFLAAAAKVTAYSSPLMLVWVLLGGIQILLAIYAWDHKLYLHHTIRVQQIALAVSLSAAHIGGLLWYELTVYRGVRGVQYANR